MHEEGYSYILSAEFVGIAEAKDGHIEVGGVRVPWTSCDVPVYIRRDSKDLSTIEIHTCRHDGLAQEELDHQNEEAENDPLGPKEYWRRDMVGKGTYGADQHLMTDEDFEEMWEDWNAGEDDE